MRKLFLSHLHIWSYDRHLIFPIGLFTILILNLLLPQSAFSQNTLQWSKNLGGSLNDIGTSIYPTNDGGCLITGYTFSYDGDISLSKGNGDIWLSRIASNGNIQWEKNYGGQGFDKPTSVLKAADGSIILLYNSRSADSKPNLGGTDCYIVKLSSNGNVIWLKSIGGTADDYGKSIIGDGLGGFYIVGNTLSKFDNTENKAIPDAWLVHINNQGESLWNKTFGGIHADFFERIIKHEDQLLIVGNSESNINQTVNRGASDAWLMATDLDGNLLWSKTFGSTQKDSFNDLIVDENGNIICIGYTFQQNNKDVFLVHANAQGNLVMDKILGGSGVDEAVSLAIKDNKIHLWSNTSSDDGDFEISRVGSDAVLSILDSIGNIETNTFFGGSKEDAIYEATFNENGDFFAVGFSQSSDGNVFENKGLSDIWLLKLGDSEEEDTTNVTAILGEPIQICLGNSVEINLTDSCVSCSFEWEDGTNQVSRILNPQETSIYMVTITDELGQTSIGSIEIEVLAPLEVEIVEIPISCKGASDGAIELLIEGGSGSYGVVWNNGATEENQYELNSDIYHVTITDKNTENCSAVANIILTNPTELSSLAVIENIRCFGETTGQIVLNVNGGNSPYFYNWSNGENTSTISKLDEGNYSVTITDNNGCTKLANYNISTPTELATEISIENPSTNQSDGSILLIPSGGNPPYEINWSTGNSGAGLNNLSNGSYTYTLTDSNECSFTESVLIGTTSTDNTDLVEIFIQPNPNNGTFVLKSFVGKVEVFTLGGKPVFETQVETFDTVIGLPNDAAKGIYFLRCIGKNQKSIQIKKLIIH